MEARSRLQKKSSRPPQAAIPPEAVGLLLEKRENDVKITEDIIKAAVGGSTNCTLVMTMLFEKCESKTEITEDIVVTAAGNDTNTAPILTLLLRKSNVKITERVTKAMAKNSISGREMIFLAFGQVWQRN